MSDNRIVRGRLKDEIIEQSDGFTSIYRLNPQPTFSSDDAEEFFGWAGDYGSIEIAEDIDTLQEPVLPDDSDW